MFIERLKFLLKENGLTSQQFLSELQFGRNQFLKWEKTGALPNRHNLAAIADYFGVTVEYLLGETDNPYPKTRIPSKTLSDVESRLIDDFRSLNKQGQEFLLQAMNAAVTTYKKDYSSAAVEESGEVG